MRDQLNQQLQESTAEERPHVEAQIQLLDAAIEKAAKKRK
jgi:hypothetical protein